MEPEICFRVAEERGGRALSTLSGLVSWLSSWKLELRTPVRLYASVLIQPPGVRWQAAGTLVPPLRYASICTAAAFYHSSRQHTHTVCSTQH
eukprot:3424511-Rhodomonas_salina.1